VTTGRVLSAASAWALAAALLLTGCSDSAAGKPARNAAPPAVPVTAADAVEKTVPIQLSAVGNAMAYTTVGIKSQVNGQIVQVHFNEGQDVRKNDLLFTIDPRPFEAALRQAEAALRQRQAEVQQAIANLERDTAQLTNARAQERRYRELVARELVAREQYEQLQTNLAAMEATVQADRAAVENAKASERAAQANVDNARLQLGYTEIRSPIDGRTGNLLVQNGNVIKANDDNPLVVINQVHPIYVSFSVPEQYLADIKKYRTRGPLRVEARLPRQLETISTGELTFVNNAVDQTTATIQLKATFPNTDNALWPGQFLDVVLTFTSRTAIVVPSQAIQPGQQGPFVFVVKPDATVESRPVAPGTRLGAETIIEQGLRAGERVVTDGQLRLVPGAKVEIRPPKTS
jgi:multidrug efflux system membrane fusion protein